MIEFQHVSKIYKGGKVAVEDVNLSLKRENLFVSLVPVVVVKLLVCE